MARRLLCCHILLQVSTLGKAYELVLQGNELTWQMLEQRIVHLNRREKHIFWGFVRAHLAAFYDALSPSSAGAHVLLQW